jgi:hypothetical protein
LQIPKHADVIHDQAIVLLPKDPVGPGILTPAHAPDTAVYFTEQYRKQYRIGGFDLAPGQDEQAEMLSLHLKMLVGITEPWTGPDRSPRR